MTRLERLKSGIEFLFWGLACVGLFFATAVGLPALGLSDDSVVILTATWFLGIFAVMGLGGGLYLIVRALI